MTKEEFKQKLKTRVAVIRIFMILFFLISLLVRLYDHFIGITINGTYLNFLSGFITGASISQLIFAAFIYIKYVKALKGKEQFDKLYICATDERTLFIKQKSGADVILPLSMLQISAALIAGYFDFTVCITLICAAIVQMLICVVLQLYFSNKY